MVRSLQLIVEYAGTVTDYCVVLSKEQFKLLELSDGDSVVLKTSNNRKTVCLVSSSETCPEGRIQMNGIIRRNLKLIVEDSVQLEVCTNVPIGTRIRVLPLEDTVSGMKKATIEEIVKKYITNCSHHFYLENQYCTTGYEKEIEFQVAELSPSPFCKITPKTEIICERNSIIRKDDICFEYIGGYSDSIKQLNELIKPVVKKNSFNLPKGVTLNLPIGVILEGPKGGGKFLMVKTIANELGVNLYTINCTESVYTDVEKGGRKLREIINEADENKPSIIFFEEFDTIAYKENKSRAMRTHLIDTIEAVKKKKEMFLVATTINIDSIHPVMLSAGRFDQLIKIGPPSETERLDILRILTKDFQLSQNVDLREIASKTNGYMGADLSSYISKVIIEAMKNSSANTVLTMEDFSVEKIPDKLECLVKRSSIRATSDSNTMQAELDKVTRQVKKMKKHLCEMQIYSGLVTLGESASLILDSYEGKYESDEEQKQKESDKPKGKVKKDDKKQKKGAEAKSDKHSSTRKPKSSCLKRPEINQTLSRPPVSSYITEEDFNKAFKTITQGKFENFLRNCKQTRHAISHLSKILSNLYFQKQYRRTQRAMLYLKEDESKILNFLTEIIRRKKPNYRAPTFEEFTFYKLYFLETLHRIPKTEIVHSFSISDLSSDESSLEL